MDRKEDGLQALGAKTTYRMDYAPEVLETFVNKHPGNDYWVRFNCPEFTSLCPITGQPDFAEIPVSSATYDTPAVSGSEAYFHGNTAPGYFYKLLFSLYGFWKEM